eukprot:3244072-Prorocentrum_lima.AAC.1
MKAYPGGTGGGTGVAGASPLRYPTSIPTARGPITSILEEQEIVDDADTGGIGVAGASGKMTADAPPY